MSLGKTLVETLYRCLPKRPVAVLSGQPDYCDDVLALERVLRDTGLSKVVILCHSSDGPAQRSRYAELSPRTMTVTKRTFAGVWYALTAKYIFFTHSWPIQKCPDSVESVNVWHGMPVKRVGWTTPSGPDLPLVKYSVATSPFWEGVVRESLRPRVKTFVTGLPRNDRLVLGDRGVMRSLGVDPDAGARMIAWLPTYRRGGRKSGDGAHCSHVFDLTTEELSGLNDMLREHEAILVIKRHPWVQSEDAPELSNIVYLDDQWLAERGLTLHELLGESSALVTDVSSAYVDYLVLDRPIVHHFPDIDAYAQQRGYSFEPIRDYLAGPVVEDPAGLSEALRAILEGRDTHVQQRHRVAELFHDPLGGSAAERLVEALGLARGAQ